MDEMKLKLSTKFMRGIVAKLISKVIRSKLGYDIGIELNEIDIEMKDGKVHLHVSVDGEMNTEDFVKIVKLTDSE